MDSGRHLHCSRQFENPENAKLGVRKICRRIRKNFAIPTTIVRNESSYLNITTFRDHKEEQNFHFHWENLQDITEVCLTRKSLAVLLHPFQKTPLPLKQHALLSTANLISKVEARFTHPLKREHLRLPKQTQRSKQFSPAGSRRCSGIPTDSQRLR